ncbi:hypothetical protein SCE1572_07430 [Sorangium cellulosum So0157-2]|uniref:Uncharacterized protein n=2 Tax=Sorangium cellulosum TaxID=56 RepID=S4XPK4_SORCE|nr:hypothetical protein SCE1572_07430 [Sorangium cellulosum So0157-2]
MVQVVNYAGALAGPRVAQSLGAGPSREELLALLDRFIALNGDGSRVTIGDGRPIHEVTAHARTLRALCDTWTPSPEVPVAIQRAARSLLAAFGIPEPREGWDELDPPPEEPPELEDPDSRPLPTGAELAARPHPFHFGVALQWCCYLASPRMVAKIPPADLRLPALGHLDDMLALFRTARSKNAEGRAYFATLINRLETLRALCEAWDGSEAPPARVQEVARAVHMQLQHASDPREYDELDEDVDPVYLTIPKGRSA